MCRGERHRSSSVRQRRGARIQIARSAGACGAARGPGEMAPGRCNHAQVCEDPAYSLGLGRPNPRRIKLLYSAGDPASRVPARDCQTRLYTCSAAWLNVSFSFPAGLPAAIFAPRDQRDAKPAGAGALPGSGPTPHACRDPIPATTGDRMRSRQDCVDQVGRGTDGQRLHRIKEELVRDGPSRKRSRCAPRIAPIKPEARPAA